MVDWGCPGWHLTEEAHCMWEASEVQLKEGAKIAVLKMSQRQPWRASYEYSESKDPDANSPGYVVSETGQPGAEGFVKASWERSSRKATMNRGKMTHLFTEWLKEEVIPGQILIP